MFVDATSGEPAWHASVVDAANVMLDDEFVVGALAKMFVYAAVVFLGRFLAPAGLVASLAYYSLAVPLMVVGHIKHVSDGAVRTKQVSRMAVLAQIQTLKVALSALVIYLPVYALSVFARASWLNMYRLWRALREQSHGVALGLDHVIYSAFEAFLLQAFVQCAFRLILALRISKRVPGTPAAAIAYGAVASMLLAVCETLYEASGLYYYFSDKHTSLADSHSNLQRRQTAALGFFAVYHCLYMYPLSLLLGIFVTSQIVASAKEAGAPQLAQVLWTPVLLQGLPALVSSLTRGIFDSMTATLGGWSADNPQAAQPSKYSIMLLQLTAMAIQAFSTFVKLSALLVALFRARRAFFAARRIAREPAAQQDSMLFDAADFAQYRAS